MSETHYVVYVIESKVGQQRNFRPALHWGAFYTKREASAKVKELETRKTHYTYRIIGYWDKRPW